MSDELILKPQIAPHPNGIGRTLQLQPLPQHPTPQPTVFHPDGILFGLTHLLWQLLLIHLYTRILLPLQGCALANDSENIITMMKANIFLVICFSILIFLKLIIVYLNGTNVRSVIESFNT